MSPIPKKGHLPKTQLSTVVSISLWSSPLLSEPPPIPVLTPSFHRPCEGLSVKSLLPL